MFHERYTNYNRQRKNTLASDVAQLKQKIKVGDAIYIHEVDINELPTVRKYTVEKKYPHVVLLARQGRNRVIYKSVDYVLLKLSPKHEIIGSLL